MLELLRIVGFLLFLVTVTLLLQPQRSGGWRILLRITQVYFIVGTFGVFIAQYVIGDMLYLVQLFLVAITILNLWYMSWNQKIQL